MKMASLKFLVSKHSYMFDLSEQPDLNRQGDPKTGPAVNCSSQVLKKLLTLLLQIKILLL